MWDPYGTHTRYELCIRSFVSSCVSRTCPTRVPHGPVSALFIAICTSQGMAANRDYRCHLDMSPTQYHTGGTRSQRDRLCPYYRSRLCPFQSGPIRPSRVIIIRKGFKSKIRWSVNGLKLSKITRWTILRLPTALQTAWGRLSWGVSWPPLVTIVPVLQRQRSRLCPATVTAVPILQTREIVTLWALCLYICYLTGIDMLMKEITRYRDPSMWRIKALVHVRHIYIETRLYMTWLH